MSKAGVPRRCPVVAFFPNHPSQVWVLRPVVEELERQGVARGVWFLRDKDVTLAIAQQLGLRYVVVSRARSGILGNAWELLSNIPRCIRLTRQHRIDAWVTKYGCGSIAAVLTGRPSIAFNDDDADVVPLIALTSYPFSERVIVPAVTRMGRYEGKARRYAANHELFYLHPNRFTPDASVRDLLGLESGTPYALIRLSALKAHHDRGVRGIDTDLVWRVIELGKRYGVRLFISSEKPLGATLEPHRLAVPVHRIHDALAFAEFLVADSQTMTAEAAMMGTPSYRVSDFVGRLSYIEEIERYGLSFGYLPDEGKRMLEDVERVMRDAEVRRIVRARRMEFLRAHPDPVPWFVANLKEVLDAQWAAAESSGNDPDRTR